MVKNYPGLEIEKKKFLIKKAMKKHLEKGTIKQVRKADLRQPGRSWGEVCLSWSWWGTTMFFTLFSYFLQLKGKGLSGTFAIGNKPILAKVSGR